MGVEWSSCMMTRRPFLRRYSVYLIGGSTRPADFCVTALPFFCASAGVRPGAASSTASATASKRFQRKTVFLKFFGVGERVMRSILARRPKPAQDCPSGVGLLESGKAKNPDQHKR